MIKWILSLLALVNLCVAHPSSSSTSFSSTRGTSTASTTKATTITTATATSTTLFGEFKGGEILTEVDGLYVYNVTSHNETEAQFTRRAGEAFIQEWGLKEAYEKMLSEQPSPVPDYTEVMSNGVDAERRDHVRSKSSIFMCFCRKIDVFCVKMMVFVVL